MSAPDFEFRDSPIGAAGPGFYAAGGKRLFDLSLALLLAPVVLAVIAVAAVAILATGGAPFYAQTRVGRNGGTFRCWKLRTMVRDADTVLDRILTEDPGLAQEWATRQKLNRDPRITRIGRILRATSLDELPQIWNVLCGDMSFVGPRPFTPEQQAGYARLPGSDAYFRLRPGITGLWQTRCRNSHGFAVRVPYDRAYERHIGLGTDLRLIVATFGVVLAGSGQ